MPKPEPGYENLSAKPTEWKLVVNPTPVFGSAKEKLSLETALKENPRREGEGLLSWLERGNVAAGIMTLSQCREIEEDPEAWRDRDIRDIFGPGADDE